MLAVRRNRGILREFPHSHALPRRGHQSFPFTQVPNMLFQTRLTLAAAVAVAITAPSMAAITVFDSRATFNIWGQLQNDMNLAHESFASVTPAYTQSTTFVGELPADANWRASALGGLGSDGNTLRTLQAGRAIQFDFDSGKVYGVGADFFYANAQGVAVSGMVVLTLSDGTQFVRSVSGTDTFAGFWSDGAAITSLKVTPVGVAGNNNFLGTDDMDIGFVPAPGALALLCTAGVGLGGRRRRTS